MSLGEIIATAGQVEKLGIVGILVILCGLLGYAVFYFRKENMRLYGLLETERTTLYDKLNRLKLAFIIVENAAKGAGAQYDLSQIKGLEEIVG